MVSELPIQISHMLNSPQILLTQMHTVLTQFQRNETQCIPVHPSALKYHQELSIIMKIIAARTPGPCSL